MKLVSALLCTALAVFSSIPTGTAATADTPAAAPTAGPQPGGGKNGDKLERLRTDAQALSASLRDLQRDIQQLDADLTKAGAAETSVLRKQRQGKYVELNDALELLVPAINKLIEAGGDAREFKAVAEASTKDLSKYLRAEIANAAELVSSLNEQVSAAPASETGKLMRRLPEARSAVDELLTMQFVNLKRMQALGMDGAADLKRLDELLIERAERLAGEMSVLVDQRKGVATEVAGATEDEKKSLKAEVSALTERIKLIARSLKSTTELLDERNIETAGYKRLLIAETGEITEDIFETQVFVGLLREWIELGRQWLVSDAPRWFFKLIVFLLILLVFMLLANLTRRVIRRGVATSRLHFSQLLQEFFVAFAGKAVLFVGILIALSQMGMQLAPVLAGLGIAGFIVGFALQDTLSNFAAGLMILIYRPFDVGDAIEAGGVTGKVKQMNLVSTTIGTWDNQKVIIPNKKIWGDVIRNITAEEVRRVDMVFGIGYDDDIDDAERVLREIVEGHELVLADPAPVIKLHTLAASSVDFVVRPWAMTADYWTVYWDITRAVKKRFDAEGISIPFPQQDMHVYQHLPEAVAASPQPS